MRSYYIKKRNYYSPDEQIDYAVPEVVFLGHFENDGRANYITYLASKGICIGVR